MSVAVCNEAFFIFLLFQVSSESLQAVTLSDLARSKGLSPINNWWGFITEPVGAAGSSLVIKLVDTLALNHSWNSGPIEALGGLCSLLGIFFVRFFHCSAFISIPWWFLCRTVHPGSPGRIPVLIIVFCPASFHFSSACWSPLFPEPRC